MTETHEFIVCAQTGQTITPDSKIYAVKFPGTDRVEIVSEDALLPCFSKRKWEILNQGDGVNIFVARADKKDDRGYDPTTLKVSEQFLFSVSAQDAFFVLSRLCGDAS